MSAFIHVESMPHTHTPTPTPHTRNSGGGDDGGVIELYACTRWRDVRATVAEKWRCVSGDNKSTGHSKQTKKTSTNKHSPCERFGAPECRTAATTPAQQQQQQKLPPPSPPLTLTSISINLTCRSRRLVCVNEGSDKSFANNGRRHRFAIVVHHARMVFTGEGVGNFAPAGE